MSENRKLRGDQMKKFRETDRVRETDREKMRVKAEMVYM